MRPNRQKFKKRLLVLATAAVSLCTSGSGHLFAQPASSVTKIAPTADELAKRIAIAAALADAKVNAAASAEASASASQATTQRQPLINVDALPKPLAKSGGGLIAPNAASLDALTRKFTHVTGSSQQPALLVFVSMSMPATSLQRLIVDAQRYDATLVLRGMVGGSLTETAVRVQKLLGTHSVSWVIDPDAFKRHSVQSVPTYVLVRDGSQAIPSCGADQCEAQSSAVRLAGDVPIRYALDQFRTQSGFTAVVDRFQVLADSRGRP